MVADRLPRLVVAGTHSGVGKTSIVLGLIAALRLVSIAPVLGRHDSQRPPQAGPLPEPPHTGFVVSIHGASLFPDTGVYLCALAVRVAP